MAANMSAATNRRVDSMARESTLTNVRVLQESTEGEGEGTGQPAPSSNAIEAEQSSGKQVDFVSNVWEKLRNWLQKEKMISLRKISLDSNEHFVNDDFVIALLTTVPMVALSNDAVAVGQLELP